MGWASGSSLAESLWLKLRKQILEEHRQKAARFIIEAFEGEDCDTLDEAEKLVNEAGEVWFRSDR